MAHTKTIPAATVKARKEAELKNKTTKETTPKKNITAAKNGAKKPLAKTKASVKNKPTKETILPKKKLILSVKDKQVDEREAIFRGTRNSFIALATKGGAERIGKTLPGAMQNHSYDFAEAFINQCKYNCEMNRRSTLCGRDFNDTCEHFGITVIMPVA